MACAVGYYLTALRACAETAETFSLAGGMLNLTPMGTGGVFFTQLCTLQPSGLPQAGFQRRMGLRAAVTSSRRVTRVVYGAFNTKAGSCATSSAIACRASTKASNSSLLALSVGSIISAPGTISG